MCIGTCDRSFDSNAKRMIVLDHGSKCLEKITAGVPVVGRSRSRR
jgi:hypothetical protein